MWVRLPARVAVVKSLSHRVALCYNPDPLPLRSGRDGVS